MNTPLKLPAKIGQENPPSLPDTRQITLVGGNGAGKSRFMMELQRLCGDRAFFLSALRAGFPQLEVCTSPNSIDARYREAVISQPYMRTDAVSEIDKLTYMLFIDEFEYLLDVKNRQLATGEKIQIKPTGLDRLKILWERLFPNNKVVRQGGKLMFSTGAGADLVPVSKLSQGEKTVFYYIAGVLYAAPDSVVFVESPSLFIHPSILNNLWNSIEQLRPDCIFVYDSVDEDFVATRTRNTCIWIRSYDSLRSRWDYQILPSGHLSEDLFFDLIGSRKPVLFIEGDARNSIDAKLYTLVFSDYTVRPLGSCDKVIETTRTFNDQKYLHHLDSHGIVDRDRRTDIEVEYLRRKNIYVPEVAEVENLFLVENVIKVMARARGKNPDKVFAKVRQAVVAMFASRLEEQALMHVRHRVKREVEMRIDARFTCITAMEMHIKGLVKTLRPREHYENIRRQFQQMADSFDYAGILRVFNHKPMLSDCNVAQLLGFASRDAYIAGVLSTLKSRSHEAEELRNALKYSFGLLTDGSYAPEYALAPKPKPAPRVHPEPEEEQDPARARKKDRQSKGDHGRQRPPKRQKRRRRDRF